MFKNNINKTILVLVIYGLFFVGCASKLEIQKETNIDTWIKNGYTKETAKKWFNHNFWYEEAKPWIEIGVTNEKVAYFWKYTTKATPEFVKGWYDNGFKEIKDIALWNNSGFTPLEAKEWNKLGLKPEQVKKINFTDMAKELKKQKISIDEYKLWLKFGLVQPDDISFFKSKGYTLDSIKDKNAKDILNNMKLEKFFQFMGIKKERLKNHYIVHWKFDTNFKRFRDIVHKYYSIK